MEREDIDRIIKSKVIPMISTITSGPSCFCTGWRIGTPRGDLLIDYCEDGVIVYRHPYSVYSQGQIYPGMEGRGEVGRLYLPGEEIREDGELAEIVDILRQNGVKVYDCPIECVCEAVMSKITVGAWLRHRRQILHGSSPEEREAGTINFFADLMAFDGNYNCPICNKEVPVEITPELLKKLGL